MITTRPNRTLRALAAVALGGSLIAGLTSAAHSAPSEFGAGLTITPLRIEIEDANRGATVMLTNSSQRALPVQTRLFAWSQAGGEDVYAPSSELTISPSITSIPPGETQIVRVLRAGPAVPGEKRYRLIVDQLPDPALARAGEAEARIRFSVPVFLDRSKASPAQLDWRIGPGGLELTNAGGLTARIVQVEVKNVAGAIVPLERNSLRYVLGNSTIAWPMENACAIGTVTVTASIDGGTVNAQPRSTCS
ncbi:fimbria/pilus periplasmic chaperone [Altererythrobacter aerius]|uniref:Fimbria/pilus periplasmic chaperone n=1 Tax=Tsuneonella aeria TaxID=1837929 RepID=A0A6I4THD7_9SPHN|nr:fimbria/pilus periplasmic chaperone [Tsuneonella aeria]MXO75440.1 fimbria/pilus periplasmic chaperone [Tsuneonella aeria]